MHKPTRGEGGENPRARDIHPICERSSSGFREQSGRHAARCASRWHQRAKTGSGAPQPGQPRGRGALRPWGALSGPPTTPPLAAMTRLVPLPVAGLLR